MWCATHEGHVHMLTRHTDGTTTNYNLYAHNGYHFMFAETGGTGLRTCRYPLTTY